MPIKVWKEYQKGIDYNNKIDLYNTVRTNENIFIGKQWEGVYAPDLDKPVFNTQKRVVNLQISTIVSDDISASVEPFLPMADVDDAMKVINTEIDRTIEYSKAKQKNRDMLRNACVDGDGCFYIYNDLNAQTGQTAQGLIDIELIDNTNIIFGNPQVHEVQKQPYIILVQRKTIESVKEEAEENGIKEDDISTIQPDSDSNLINDELTDDMVTVLVKLWKKNGTVWCSKSTNNCWVKEPFDTKYKLYPVAFMPWEKVKNCYHGQSLVSEQIPNQKFINKTFAMAMDSVKKNSFPKLIYNKDLLPNGVSNRIGEAIGINGNPQDAIIDSVRPPDMSSKVMELVEKTMQYTKEYMGASDASLGNVKPDNTSAIIAIQQATAAPLELVKKSFYQFVEDYIRIFIDIMRVDYGVRMVPVDGVDEMGEKIKTLAPFDFSILNEMVLNLNVNIGASAYWSETMQVQTADNLFKSGIITNKITYLESIPDAYVKNKAKIIEDLEQDEQIQQMMMEQQSMIQQQMQGVPQEVPI